METIPRLRLLDKEKSKVLQTAEAKGFSWCYEYPAESTHGVLAALMLGMLFQEKALRGSGVWTALKGSWEHLDLFKLSADQQWFEMFRNAGFWRGLEQEGLLLAQKVCKRRGKDHLLPSLQMSFNEDVHAVLLQKLCEDLALELHVLKQDVEGKVMSTRYNDNTRRIRCYVVIAVEEGTVFYLGHERFKVSRVETKAMEFPFATDCAGTPPHLMFHREDTPEAVIRRLVEFITSARARFSGLEQEYADCQAAVEAYSRVAGEGSLQLPELLEATPYDQSEHSSSPIRENNSAHKQSTLEQGEGTALKQCSNCHLYRLSKHVFSHYIDQHSVCVCCLQSLQCPCCGLPLGPRDCTKVRSLLS